ncbi:AAC-rich mRNA clone AAC4 protein-like [Babylonia areolata]|uniref:AAC-rich mRNA clone AAC4 protein-like n=1 Tax=Babylonia areolata TaxID=304850 RepID=UPI003FD2B4BF
MIADYTSGGITQCDFVLSGSISQLQFSPGGFKLLTLPNAGGSSVWSEALSFELLQRCFRATLIKTEMEIEYFPMGGSMTDYLCSICGCDVAVSVTRAMKYRGDYTQEDAELLLNKKLKGVVRSNHNAVTRWSKQILHIWASSAMIAKTVACVYDCIDPKIKANTVVLITTAAQSPFIFENG